MNIILFEQMPARQTIVPSDYRYDHLRNILHLETGDSFTLGVVNQSKGRATITGYDAEGCHFTFVETDKDSSKLYPVTLLVSQVRPICMRRILREAVSLGVQNIILCTCELTEKSYQLAKLYTTGEYKSILLDGAMQSGQTGVSQVFFASTVQEAIALLSDTSQKILLDNVIGTSSLSRMQITREEVVLSIGPERGFSDQERALFLQAGFEPALLGKRILRTETACSGAIAVLLGRMGLL
ncbi:MAG: RsmE family RNA methyltransferase [Sphaerochaetaceae bacterium]